MSEMKKLRYAVLQGQAQGQQAPLQQEQVQEGEQIQPIEEAPVLARGPGRRSDWHYWGANWAAKNPDIPRDANFSLKMAEAYRAWKDAHPGQTYLDFRGTDVIDDRRRLTQKKGKKVGPAPSRQVTPPPRQATPPPLAPLREPTPPPLAPLREPTPPPRQATPPPPRQATPPPLAPLREPTPPPRQATPPPPAPLPLKQKTPNKYSQPSPGPLSTPSLLQGRRETPPQEYYEPAEEQEFSPEEEEQVEEAEQPVRVPIQEESVEESPEEEAVQQEEAAQEEQLSPEEEAAIEAAQEEQLSPEEEQPEASPEWPEEEEQAEEGDLEIVTIGQQEYFRTSNNGLFTVIRDEEGNPDIGSWAGVLSEDGTQVVETEQPEEP